MALQRLRFDLTTKFTQKKLINGFGFFVQSVPVNSDVQIIYDNNPNNKVIVGVQSNIPILEGFREFTITSNNALSGKYLDLYYAERPEDFDNLPNNPNSPITGSLEETNTLLSDLNDKTIEVNTDDVTITNSGDIAKEVTQQQVKSNLDDIKTYLDDDEGKLDSLITNTSDNATQTTLALIKTNTDDIKGYIDEVETKLDSIITNTNDVSTETTLLLVKSNLDDIKTYIDGVETLLLNIYDQVNSYVDDYSTYAEKNKKTFVFSYLYTADKQILITNKNTTPKKVFISVYDIRNRDSVNDLDIGVYVNPTTTGSVNTTYTAPVDHFNNKSVGSSASNTDIKIQDVTGYSGGYLIFEDSLDGSQFVKGGIGSTSIIEILPSNSLLWDFSNSSDYKVLFNIIED